MLSVFVFPKYYDTRSVLFSVLGYFPLFLLIDGLSELGFAADISVVLRSFIITLWF